MACKCAIVGDDSWAGGVKEEKAAPDLAGRIVRERCRDGQRLRCRPVLHPSFAAGWLGARDRQGGIIVQAVKRMLERWRTLTEDRQEASGNVVQVAEPRRADRQEGS